MEMSEPSGASAGMEIRWVIRRTVGGGRRVHLQVGTHDLACGLGATHRSEPYQTPCTMTLDASTNNMSRMESDALICKKCLNSCGKYTGEGGKPPATGRFWLRTRGPVKWSLQYVHYIDSGIVLCTGAPCDCKIARVGMESMPPPFGDNADICPGCRARGSEFEARENRNLQKRQEAARRANRAAGVAYTCFNCGINLAGKDWFLTYKNNRKVSCCSDACRPKMVIHGGFGIFSTKTIEKKMSDLEEQKGC